MGLKRHTREKIENQVELRNPFRIGNISAIRYNAGETPHMGILPAHLADQLKGVLRNNDVYVVYSFQTPIGWSKCDGNGEWFIPDVKYSITTTHHQSVLRVASNRT